MNNNLKKSAKVIGEVFDLLMGKNFTSPLDRDIQKHFTSDTYVDINKNSL